MTEPAELPKFQRVVDLSEIKPSPDSLAEAYKLLEVGYKDDFPIQPNLTREAVEFIDTLPEKVKLAFICAAKIHEYHKPRGTGEPYIFHPIEVVKILKYELGETDEDTLIAAFLHDTVEDHPNLVNIMNIRLKFGPTVATMVEGVTKIKTLVNKKDSLQLNPSWITNSNLTHNRLLISVKHNSGSLLIKFADRIHNLRTIEGLKPDKRVGVANETLEIYVPLATAVNKPKIALILTNLCLLYSRNPDLTKFVRQSSAVKQNTFLQQPQS